MGIMFYGDTNMEEGMGYFVAFVAGGLTVKYWWPFIMKAYNAHLDAVIEKKLKGRSEKDSENEEG
jgi:hypothetical protein